MLGVAIMTNGGPRWACAACLRYLPELATSQ